jgi:hypothetical protein
MASDPIKILIVDDDEAVLIEREWLLEGEGYSTATAWSGREALARSDRLRFDQLPVDEFVGDSEARPPAHPTSLSRRLPPEPSGGQLRGQKRPFRPY